MPDGVNGVNGAQEVTASGTQSEPRVVEQKTEEMFDYDLKNAIGDGVSLSALGVVSAGVGHTLVNNSEEASTDNVEDGKADKSEYYSGDYGSDYLKFIEYCVNSQLDISKKGFSTVIREQKENADEYIEKHPIMSWIDGARLFRLYSKLF